MSTFDETGLVVDRFVEIQDKLRTSFKDAFGADLKVDPDSVAGQIIDIISDALADQNELLQGVADTQNPQAAKGVFLSNLVMLNGIIRKEARFSTVALSVTAGNAATTIPSGSLATDSAGINFWSLDDDVDLVASETKVVSATCTVSGKIEASPGEIDTIKTPQFSWVGVTNVNAASPGLTEETDSALRIRRNIASLVQGGGSVPDIFTNVSNVEGVLSVRILENKGFETDENGLPPHYVWVIVKGGTDNDVGLAILGTECAGIGQFGGVDVVVTDPETEKDFTVTFSRQRDVPVYVKLELKKKSNYPATGDDDIKQAFVDYYAGNFEINGGPSEGFGIGDNVEYSRQYSPANSVIGHTISALYISKFDPPVGLVDLNMDPDEMAYMETSQITIVEV